MHRVRSPKTFQRKSVCALPAHSHPQRIHTQGKPNCDILYLCFIVRCDGVGVDLRAIWFEVIMSEHNLNHEPSGHAKED